MDTKKSLNNTRFRRMRRTRAKISGVSSKPRLSVFRSNVYTYVQLIDDAEGKTLINASTMEAKKSKSDSRKAVAKQKQAESLGELVAKKAIEKGIKEAVFDRRQYKYHGRVKAVAEGARKGGLKI